MEIYIGSDHAGFKLKEKIKKYIKKYKIIDLGTGSEESCDYPDYAEKVAEKVSKTNGKGILICGSGIGMSIAANKVNGARAGLARDVKDAEMGRRHNNINILCLGERFTEEDKAKQIVDVFLNTPFEGDSKEGERHKRRADKFKDIEKRHCK